MKNNKEYTGHAGIKELKGILSSFSIKKIFLVTGNKSYVICGAKKEIDLIASDLNVVHFKDFQLNPKIEDIEKGISLFKKEDPDGTVAVGGGSVIDTAKLIHFYAENGLNPFETPDHKKEIVKKRPLIAIPTTAGSGSESTHFAVLYKDKVKHSTAHEKILPDIAIIDPDLTMSLPPYTTAVTGMDALAQAIESYWNINSTEGSQEYARSSIALIIDNITTAVLAPTRTSRTAMAKAAHLAGKAINITKTTASHAVSYPLTSYFGIPHGHAVALTLPAMLEYNGDVSKQDIQDQRGVMYVKQTVREIAEILGVLDSKGAKKKLEELMDQIKLERRLSRLGICSDEDIDLIIQNSFNPDRVKKNPRYISRSGLRDILNEIR